MIKFGADGWQAVISEEFTFENVARLARAVAVYLISHQLEDRSLVIGYDARFLSEHFAAALVKVFEGAGIATYLVERDTPTPVVAWTVADKGAAGGLMVTAGGNPAWYNGIRFIKGTGGPCAEDCFREIRTYLFLENSPTNASLPHQALLDYQSATGRMNGSRRGKLDRFEPKERYLKYILSLDNWQRIRQAKPKVVVDPMHGSGRGYLDAILQALGCRVEEVHDYRDVLFGGISPDPLEENLADLKAKMAEVKADYGIALSGDAAAWAVIDRAGKYTRSEAGIEVLLHML
jgi:phosphomannomutase